MPVFALQQNLSDGGIFEPLSPNPANSIDATGPAAGTPGSTGSVPTPPAS